MTVLFSHHITESVVLPSDEGLGSSAKHYGSGSLGSGSAGSVYLSDSQDWVVSPSCSPDEGPVQHNAISPMLAEETFRYMSKYHIITYIFGKKKKVNWGKVTFFTFVVFLPACCDWPNMWHSQAAGSEFIQVFFFCPVDDGSVCV